VVDEGPEKVMVVLMGGNRSCVEGDDGYVTPYQSGLYLRFAQMLDAARADGAVEIDSIVSCYPDGDDTIYYADSKTPDNILSTDLDGFIGVVGSAESLATANRLFLAGHSYGGWLSMKVALAVDRPYSGVYTLDPISRETCSYENPFGCTSAPEDITKAQREQIRQRSERWSNFYQNDNPFLHSSSILEAHENNRLPVGHSEVAYHARVWDSISAQVLQQPAVEEQQF
jgi:hypothetical protein